MKDEEMYCQRKTFGANFLLDPDSAAGVGHLAAAIARAAEWGAERTVAVSGAGAGRGGSSVSAALPRPHWVVPLCNITTFSIQIDMMDISDLRSTVTYWTIFQLYESPSLLLSLSTKPIKTAVREATAAVAVSVA